MEFVEACKIVTRMCAGRSCDECPLVAHKCSLPTEEAAKEMAPIIEQWARENPAETRQDHFFKMFPNAPRAFEHGDTVRVMPSSCPEDLGWETRENCGKYESCAECWAQEYVEKG